MGSDVAERAGKGAIDKKALLAKYIAERDKRLRADGNARTGQVQEIIKICQEKGFEKFALRAKYDEGR